MPKYVYIESYAHAERLGIKPIDSIIDTIVDVEACRKGQYVIVGCSEGHTFTHSEPYQDNANKTYIAEICSIETELYAKNLSIAKMLLRHDYTKGTCTTIYLKKFVPMGTLEV